MADTIYVVAIDFGTAYSGYSFCVKSVTENIRSVFWGVEHGLRTQKTPTCILFDESQKFINFGYDAVMTYKRMNKSEAKMNYFFENFKMELYNKTITRTMKVSAKNGKPLSALKVFSESLRYMKDHVLKTIQEHSSKITVTVSDITWILTVPAIWDAGAKQFMREAAMQAGLVPEFNSENLILALEPEAASVWCKQLPQEGFLTEGLSEDTLQCSPGLQYIVVDCGGGTIDMTVHEVLENEGLKEIHKASGGNMGEINIDYILLVGGYASCKFLQRRVQEQFSSRCTVLCPIESQLAIAKGAVLFGNDPKIITSRVSARTYGIATAVDFIPLKHPKEKRKVNRKGDYVYCDDVFHSFVKKGQSVDCNDISEYVFVPIDDDQEEMRFNFYSTENENVMYIDDAGVKKIGSFDVPMPNTFLGRNRSVRFNVKFGLTELQATATDLSSNQTQCIRLDFLTE
ncbi:hypothetical protein AGOR_G00235310 [Albula goreensis]|uniref:Heat shock 70 kDa protein 12A n=1 Tax=Albula goreensis TaxID=1534307 RepID=A0A8T3CFE8_9TELE|nr:hypothetical protein AGOR_G00235310 [Albula goreensis]